MIMNKFTQAEIDEINNFDIPIEYGEDGYVDKIYYSFLPTHLGKIGVFIRTESYQGDIGNDVIISIGEIKGNLYDGIELNERKLYEKGYISTPHLTGMNGQYSMEQMIDFFDNCSEEEFEQFLLDMNITERQLKEFL